MVISHVKSHGSAARVGLENALVLTVNIHKGKLEIQSSWACVYATLVLLLCQETSVAQMFRWCAHKPTQSEAPTCSFLLAATPLRSPASSLPAEAPCSELQHQCTCLPTLSSTRSNSVHPFSAALGITELSWGKPGVSSALQLSSAFSCILSTSSHYHRFPLSTHTASKLGQMLSCFSAGLFSSLRGTASTGLVKSKLASRSLLR